MGKVTQGGNFPLKTNRRRASGSALDRLTTTGALALIHDAIAHSLGPIHQMARAMALLERIAQALEDKRDVSDQVAQLYENHPILFRTESANLLRTCPLPIAAVNEDFRFVSWSESYRLLFELSENDLRTFRVIDLIPAKDREAFIIANRSLFEGKAQSLVYLGRRLTGNGTTIATRSTAWAVSTHPRAAPEYVMAVHERLTDSKQSAALIARCAEQLLRQRDQLLSARSHSRLRAELRGLVASRE